MRLTKAGLPPPPTAPLRSTPRIGQKYSGALHRKAWGGVTDQLPSGTTAKPLFLPHGALSIYCFQAPGLGMTGIA